MEKLVHELSKTKGVDEIYSILTTKHSDWCLAYQNTEINANLIWCLFFLVVIISVEIVSRNLIQRTNDEEVRMTIYVISRIIMLAAFAAFSIGLFGFL